MENKTIYTLGLHEFINENDYNVFRVAGGWIYMFYNRDKKSSEDYIVFVPFDNEFQQI